MNWEVGRDIVFGICIPIIVWMGLRIIDHGERLVRTETLLNTLIEDVKEIKAETKTQTPILTELFKIMNRRKDELSK